VRHPVISNDANATPKQAFGAMTTTNIVIAATSTAPFNTIDALTIVGNVRSKEKQNKFANTDTQRNTVIARAGIG
jgi:hypothetical protein